MFEFCNTQFLKWVDELQLWIFGDEVGDESAWAEEEKGPMYKQSELCLIIVFIFFAWNLPGLEWAEKENRVGLRGSFKD